MSALRTNRLRSIRYAVAFGGVVAMACLALIAGARPAAAAYPTFAIDWTTATNLSDISVAYTPGQSVTLSGFTTGSFTLPWTATINFLSSVNTDRFQLVRGTQGSVANVVQIVMGDGNSGSTRSSNQHITMDVSVGGSFPNLVSTSYSLLDVDTGNNGGSWVDQVQVTTAGATLTSQNTAVTTVNGETVTAISGNIANTANDGNVQVLFAPGVKNFSLDYRNAPGGSLTGTQQLIGLTNITFTAVPEPGTLGLLGGAGMLPLGAAVVRRRKSTRSK